MSGPLQPWMVAFRFHAAKNGFCAVQNAAMEPEASTRMTDKKQNLQDVFLNHVRKEKTAVTIFLVNGVKLQGVVTWFDNFCVLLKRDGQSQLVYKHAISTIMPSQPITLWDGEETD